MNKFINFLLLILFSIIVSYFMHEIHVVLHWVANMHLFVFNKLALIFTNARWGRIVSVTLALTIIPLFFALIPAFIYWLMKRSMMPNYMLIVWVIWFVLITILAYK